MRSRRRRIRRDVRRMRNSGGRSMSYSNRWSITHSGKLARELPIEMVEGT